MVPGSPTNTDPMSISNWLRMKMPHKVTIAAATTPDASINCDCWSNLQYRPSGYDMKRLAIIGGEGEGK